MLKRMTLIFACMFVLSGCTPETSPASLPALSSSTDVTEVNSATAEPEPTADPYFIDYDPFESAEFEGPAIWKLVGQIGGTAKSLLKEGDTLYLGVGLHVLIIDAADPQKMRMLGESPMLPEFVEGITSGGDGMLYVSCGSGGLVILDISDPSSPAVAATLDTRGYTEGTALYGKYAVIADGPNGIQIAEVSDPKNPVLVSEAYPLCYAYDVVIDGATIYAAAGGSGLLAVGLDNPQAPEEKALVKLNGFQYDVEIMGGSLYSAGAWGGVSVIDLTGSIEDESPTTIETTGWAMALSTDGTRLLVMDGADGAMLYETSGGPLLVSEYTMGGFVLAGELEGERAFLLDREKGLMTLDFASLSEPVLMSRWMPIMDGRRVTISGNTGFISGGLSGMHVIDLRSPGDPVETFWYDTKGGYANKVIVDEGTVYLTTHLDTNEPLVIFDASNPFVPVKQGFVPNDEKIFNTAFRSMELNNGHIYIPGENADVSLDVTDPFNPLFINRIDMENPINADTYGNLLITTNSNQLQLVDISEPSDIKLISYLEKNTAGEAIRFINPGMVLTSADPGIWIVDVSDPANPKKVSEMTLTGTVMDALIVENTAYLSTLGDGIQIVDISDPANPVLTDSVKTLGVAYDCFVKGDWMLVADSFAGITIYHRVSASEEGRSLDIVGREAQVNYGQMYMQTEEDNSSVPVMMDTGVRKASPEAQQTLVVKSTADSGPGSLRSCLENIQKKTDITFDTEVFPPGTPAVIYIESALPFIEKDYITIDASNAGVILDGSRMTEGNGLEVHANNCKIMGLQIMYFPQNALEVQGEWNQIGGNRNLGEGPVGQGNLTSGNSLYGIHVGGQNQLVIGNIAGLDVTGTKAVPNFYGIFVADWSFYVTVGSTVPGEGNVISGNEFVNMDTWGDHTLIIGNIFGLDITGTQRVEADTSDNLVLESGVMNAIVGGTTPGERNIISGVMCGIVLSDPNSYQCSVTGNYIGTDITGTKAIPNNTGVNMWTSGNHRVGGVAEGETNLISGNGIGIQFSGYGVMDNLVLGNRLGTDASGENCLPNDTGISACMGQHHIVIGGYTPEEGNLVCGGTFAIQISDPGIMGSYIAGNTITETTGIGAFFSNYSSDNFFQCNTFFDTDCDNIRVDRGSGNELRCNTFDSKYDMAIFLNENGNLELAAPSAGDCRGKTITGNTIPGGLVEIYIVESRSIVPLGFACADEDGIFTYAGSQQLSGSTIVLTVTDVEGNTSAFSRPHKVS